MEYAYQRSQTAPRPLINTLNVLSIGSQEANARVRDLLLVRNRCRLFAGSAPWDLSAVFENQNVDVLVLHDVLNRRELRSCARYTRRRWPDARILLVQTHSQGPDVPAVYDERMSPGSSAQTLLAAIERLAACARRGRRTATEGNAQWK